MLLDYRKDIDGLRAIAVLLVVLFHFGFPVSGGFIGVDIFFVISGFLIASLIKKQILREKFSFSSFYVHRMRRILPAFLFISFSTLVAGWFFLPPEYYDDSVRSAFYSILQYSNFFYLQITDGYFSANADTLMFLHTWSLSVETQFYLIIPVLLIILFKTTYKTKYFNIILVSLFIIFFAISEYMALHYKMPGYFLLASRFYELFIGVLLALNFDKLSLPKNRLFNELLALAALLLIFIPAFLLTKQSVFPGINAFYPTLGAALIILLAKAEQQTFVTRILSFKVMTFVGAVSYSLYLWHWPVITGFKIVGYELTLVEKSVLIILMIGLSYLTYLFVEQPFRKKFKWGMLKTFLILLLVPVLFMQVAKIVSKKTNGFVNYRFEESVAKALETQQIKVTVRDESCHDRIIKDDKSRSENCYLGDKSAETFDILLFGDSHANVMSIFLDEILKTSQQKAYPLTVSSYLYLKGRNLNVNADVTTVEEKEIYHKLLEEQITSGNYKYVVIASLFNRDYNADFYQDLNNTIQFIKQNNSIPVIIKDVPTMPEETLMCPTYNMLFNGSKNCTHPLTTVQSNQQNVNQVIDRLAAENTDLMVIDPKAILCDENVCYSNFKDVSLYVDSTHLSYAGVKELAKRYLAKLGHPFK